MDNYFLPSERFIDIRKKLFYNSTISNHYQRLAEEENLNDYLSCSDFRLNMNRSKVVQDCCSWFYTRYYQMQNIKDIKKVQRCRDKFCCNCQSMTAEVRQSKFSLELDRLRKDYKVCHVIFTVKNCKGIELYYIIRLMYKKFSHMMRYFKGDKFIHGVDFLQYGYGGAVRSLEVTYNKDKKSYHPHFHCMFLFRKDLSLEAKYINAFSYDKLHPDAQPYKFSDFEILLQKVWYLLINNQRVTIDSINDLKRGYSVKVLDSNGYYHECFKYVCDSAFEDGSILDYEVFKVLQRALYSRRVIQGYGALHNFDDFERKEVEVLADFRYRDYLIELHKVERPVTWWESLNDVVERSKTCKYLSKSLIKQIIMEERRKELEDETEM